MKKFIALILLLGLLLTLSAGAESKVYLALGDSITTGYGLNRANGEYGFADILKRNNGYTLYNKAVNGATTLDVFNALDSQYLLKTVSRADLITLTCGGNDLMGLLFTQIAAAYNSLTGTVIPASEVMSVLSNPADARQMTLMMVVQGLLLGTETTPSFLESDTMQAALDAYAQALGGIVMKIRAVNPTVPIIIATQYNPFQFFSGEYALFGQRLGQGVKLLSDVITANAQALGYYVADTYSAFADSAENLCCASMVPFNLDPHPNAAGHQVLAECFQQVINNLP